MKRRMIFMCCALMAAITICTAQNNTTDRKAALEAKRAEMVKKATERMKNELSLSDEQAVKLEELNKEYLPKMRMGAPAMRRHKPMGPDGKRSTNANAECCKKEKKCCEECGNCCKEAPKGEKSKKFDKAKKGEKAKKGNNGKKFEKPTKEQLEQRRKEMRETREVYNTKLNEILTPEQQEKLKSMRQERKGKKPENRQQH